MSIQNGCVLTHEGIEYLCGLIRDINGLDTNLIDDINIKSNGTFSSVRINTLLNALKTDCNDFANSLVSNLSRLELKIVTDEADIIEHNKLYLIKKAGETSYSQYVIVTNDSGVDEKVLLGTTDINMSDYYTITQADTKFTLKTDFDALKTEVTNLKTKVGTDTLNTTSQDLSGGVNELKTDLTSHTGDTDIHITSSERTKWNEVDNKVDKTSITTTIDSTSIDSELPTAKSVYNNVKYASGYTDTIVIDCNECVKVGYYFADRNATNNPTSETYGILHVFGYKTDIESKNTQWIFQEFTSASGKKYMRYSLNPNSLTPTNWTSWKKLCTTNVADVAPTKITLNNGFTGTISYTVKNGICYVKVDAFKSEKTGENLIVSDTLLPSPSMGTVTAMINFDRAESETGMITIVPVMDNRLRMHCYKANTNGWCTFSYPVLES